MLGAEAACEAWIDRNLLSSDDRFSPLIDRWIQTETTMPEAVKAYEKRLDVWKQKSEEAKAEKNHLRDVLGTPNRCLRVTPDQEISTVEYSHRRLATACEVPSGTRASPMQAGLFSTALFSHL